MQKLELTWIGKGQEPAVEPRILLHDASRDYGAPDATNMLIHGDNLLALKALEQEFAGRVKCVYIDPPYNTGSAFEHYDDGIEHSIWLGLMKSRLDILRDLLSNEGMLFIQIDNRELHYLKLVCDEVFGRQNFRNQIIVKKGTKNVSVQFDTVERLNAGYDTILMYSKNSALRIPNLFVETSDEENVGSWNNHWRGTDRPTMRYELFGITPENGQWRWAKERTQKAVDNYELLQPYLSLHGIDENDQSSFDGAYLRYLKEYSIADVKDFQLVRLSRRGKPEHYIPPSNKKLLSENWLDLSVAGRQTDFEHEKNEFILQRIIEWVTHPGDLVLDSFLGSGTTTAVAHKMGRRYIGIELGDHCYTHCLPRLKAVVDGEQGGISKTVDWKGGGGFKFYELAPTLIEKDENGFEIISEKYDATMLAAAVAKLCGYRFAPREGNPYVHGVNNVGGFIFVTTQYITAPLLGEIAKNFSDTQSLVICASAFQVGIKNNFPNIKLRKIPQSVLAKCEYGAENYNLNVVELPEFEETEEDFEDAE
ncbi:site-specific DNA-methyltransferase [Lachnospiraceae bacterium ZAX-1]